MIFSARDRAHYLPFSWLLPLFNLVMWLVLVIIPASLTYLSLATKAQHRLLLEIGTEKIRANIQHAMFVQFALSDVSTKRSHLITAMNMPGLISDVVVSFPIRQLNWLKAELPMESWRALTFPLFCVPAWWFVGLGFEVLAGAVKVNRYTLLFGSLLSMTFTFLGVGLSLTISSEDQGDGSWWVPLGMCLWSILFAAYPLAWMRQRRSRKIS